MQGCCQFFLIMLLTFCQILLHVSNNLSSFIEKDIHLVLSKSFVYGITFGTNMSKGEIFLASS